jgi:hypothetical protein
MSRLGRLFKSRIGVALLGIVLVGGGGAYWAVTSSAPHTPQAASSLTNTNEDPTSTASAEDPTATTTTDPGATATATTVHRTPTATPRPTATPCLTPTPVPIGQSVHWRNRLVSVNTGASTFVLSIGCGAHPTITVNTSTTWPGLAKSASDLPQYVGRTADVLATRQGDGSYLASSVNAPVSSGD